MSVSKEPQSRFKLSQPISIDGIDTYGLLKKFPFLDANSLDETDIVTIAVTPTLAGKPWAIADRLYGSPVLDWVIILFNRPINPMNWPENGSIIKAPAQKVVLPLV